MQEKVDSSTGSSERKISAKLASKCRAPPFCEKSDGEGPIRGGGLFRGISPNWQRAGTVRKLLLLSHGMRTSELKEDGLSFSGIGCKS